MPKIESVFIFPGQRANMQSATDLCYNISCSDFLAAQTRLLVNLRPPGTKGVWEMRKEPVFRLSSKPSQQDLALDSGSSAASCSKIYYSYDLHHPVNLNNSSYNWSSCSGFCCGIRLGT